MKYQERCSIAGADSCHQRVVTLSGCQRLPVFLQIRHTRSCTHLMTELGTKLSRRFAHTPSYSAPVMASNQRPPRHQDDVCRYSACSTNAPALCLDPPIRFGEVLQVFHTSTCSRFAVFCSNDWADSSKGFVGNSSRGSRSATLRCVVRLSVMLQLEALHRHDQPSAIDFVARLPHGDFKNPDKVTE